MSSRADKPIPAAGRDPAVAARVEQLYAAHASLVRSVCRSLLRDPLEAEDAVQQTFLSAHRTLANGTSPRDDAAWLATIARHECLARVRARMREPLPIELEEANSAADAHAAAVLRHDADELRKALAELPPQQREAILLREVRGLSYQEVASALSVTNSAVESLVFRARRNLQLRLREALAGLSPAWLQSLRELAWRSGNGVAAPIAAKVAAVGVGTALFAGGALTPTMIGLGPAPKSGRNGAPPPAHRAVHAAARAASVHPRRISATEDLPASTRRHDTVSNRPGALSDVEHSSDGSDLARPSGPAVRDEDGNRVALANGTSGSSDDVSKMDGGSNDRAGSSTGTSGSSGDSATPDGGGSGDSSSPTTTTEATTDTTTTTSATDTTTAASTTQGSD